MKVLYLPLDERPCNYIYPQMIALSNKEIQLNIPNLDILPKKKTPAIFENIEQFLLENVLDQDALVISLDMLLYGGLIPSRLHQLDVDHLKTRLEILKKLKQLKPDLKIYAFECIMRCPQYNSSEEEPDYYEEYGYALFKKKYLQNKQERMSLDGKEEQEFNTLEIPQDILDDYELRRQTNCQMNQLTLEYLKDGILDFLVIPQDDSSPFGYTAIDQKKILEKIKEDHLEFKTMVYPGADEVGLSLMTRAYNEYCQRTPKIYPFYASVLGPSIVPLYEDRPMLESLKSHILVTGARLTHDANQADMILAVNCPGKVMQESFDKNKDVSYSSYRNLMNFVLQIQSFIQEDKDVALVDSAYANGGDLELIHYLDELDLLDSLKGYAGWNTNCNSTGTVLAQGQLGHDATANTIYHLIEDVFYQAKVRLQVIENDLVELGLSYYDFKDQQDEVEKRIGEALLKEYCKLNVSHKYPIKHIEVSMPWKRMFEIGVKFK
ncbi:MULTISPECIES: DUF4127 family protein [Coprobacillaceae]|uniref:DUF4127 family protein n=1 Tax=Coprobacillaceae TaxID=2810280 RepID=UPI000E509B10|nr:MULTISPECIES: DUF4127 family protein [Coprobacillaceae]RHM60336.1 DUF4127 family protein [Coprobacillus sp. AF33-1AC]RHS92883.1 DUF4127 family protein [Erysipelatoclostridium sp. AM42-17]